MRFESPICVKMCLQRSPRPLAGFWGRGKSRKEKEKDRREEKGDGDKGGRVEERPSAFLWRMDAPD